MTEELVSHLTWSLLCRVPQKYPPKSFSSCELLLKCRNKSVLMSFHFILVFMWCKGLGFGIVLMGEKRTKLFIKMDKNWWVMVLKRFTPNLIGGPGHPGRNDHGTIWKLTCKCSCKATFAAWVSSSPLIVFGELPPAGTYPQPDNTCLEKKKLFTFTCFVFLAVWVKMAFHFLPQKG